MAQCDCSLKHTNGGVCNCFDNMDIPDEIIPDLEVFEENWSLPDDIEKIDLTKITKPGDDWLH